MTETRKYRNTERQNDESLKDRKKIKTEIQKDRKTDKREIKF